MSLIPGSYSKVVHSKMIVCYWRLQRDFPPIHHVFIELNFTWHFEGHLPPKNTLPLNEPNSEKYNEMKILQKYDVSMRLSMDS